MNYFWEVVAVDVATRSMQVTYKSEDLNYEITLNLPLPTEPQTLTDVIKRFVPVAQLQDPRPLPTLVSVQLGEGGVGVWQPMEPPTPLVEQIRTIVQQELLAQAK